MGGISAIALPAGKIVCVASLAVATIVLLGLFVGRGFTLCILTASAYGTAIFTWASVVLYHFAANLGDHPAEVLLTSQVRPGAGLFVGVIASASCAVVFGAIFIRQTIEQYGARRLPPLLAVHVFAVTMSSLAVFLNQRYASTNAPLSILSSSSETLGENPGQSITPFAAGKPSAQRMIDAENGAFRAGDATLSLQDVFMGAVWQNGADCLPQAKSAIVIRVRIQNASESIKFEYFGWDTYGVTSGAQLRDDLGNTYAMLHAVPAARLGSEEIGTRQVYPGQSITDVLCFEPPVERANSLFLKLPLWHVKRERTIGDPESVEVRVPMKMVTKSSRKPSAEN